MSIVVGIESSCDETAIAVLHGATKVLSSEVASQAALHNRFGGVVPEIAARKHLESLPGLFTRATQSAGIDPGEVDLIAVTQGPGLVGALLTGISFARGLSDHLRIPVQPVDHVQAHVHGALIDRDDEVPFPSLALVVSGGHTNLYYMQDPISYQLLGSSIDDACGECFDKVGKMLGLSYPAGAEIEQLARKGQPGRIKMPTMMAGAKDYKFSYSGLKTHVAYYLRKLESTGKSISAQDRYDLCYAFQEEAFRQISVRLAKACTEFKTRVRSVIIAGGVSANQRFMEILKETIQAPVISPQLKYCSDNAAMIASLGWRLRRKANEQTPMHPAADSRWDAYSRYCY